MSRRTEAKLRLYVPTKGRVDYQHTLRALPKEWLRRCIIVCPKDEIKAHKKNWPMTQIMEQGKEVRSIATARAWIFRTAYRLGHDKIAMLDDDIRFATRVKTLDQYAGIGKATGWEWNTMVDLDPDLAKLRNLGPGEPCLGRMFVGFETMLNRYAHSGMHARLMSNNHAYEWKPNTRIQQIYAYHVPTVMKHCEVGRPIMRDDFDYQLQLLTAGFECVVYCWVVGEQARGFHGKGGQDSSRTLEINNRDAYRLAKLHPGLVTVVDRQYNKMPRKEVICHWQKAAAQGTGGLL